MGWTKTDFEGLQIYNPKVFKDERGYFFESFSLKTLDFDINFVQDNEAKSSKGVLRGLHYQVGVNAQSKLVRVVKGAVQDVVVDIRPQSKTFGKHFSIVLSEENKTQLFVPRGFAHGYLVLEDDTIFVYKCDAFYDKASEGGILYNDLTLKIDWMLPENQLITSEKDMNLPFFGHHLPFT
jgi:dTDP-4-dehydrorhamnose 3,5-epimerase